MFLMYMLLLAIVVLCLVFTFIALRIVNKNLRNRRAQYEAIFKKHFGEETLDYELSAKIVERSNSYGETYFRYSFSAKVIEFFGMVFSLFVFVILALRGREIYDLYPIYENIALGVSFLAILFVLVSLYLSPLKRARQYIHAWRNVDDALRKLVVCCAENGDAKKELEKCSICLSSEEGDLTTDEE